MGAVPPAASAGAEERGARGFVDMVGTWRAGRTAEIVRHPMRGALCSSAGQGPRRVFHDDASSAAHRTAAADAPAAPPAVSTPGITEHVAVLGAARVDGQVLIQLRLSEWLGFVHRRAQHQTARTEPHRYSTGSTQRHRMSTGRRAGTTSGRSCVRPSHGVASRRPHDAMIRRCSCSGPRARTATARFRATHPTR